MKTFFQGCIEYSLAERVMLGDHTDLDAALNAMVKAVQNAKFFKPNNMIRAVNRRSKDPGTSRSIPPNNEEIISLPISEKFKVIYDVGAGYNLKGSYEKSLN